MRPAEPALVRSAKLPPAFERPEALRLALLTLGELGLAEARSHESPVEG